MIKCNNSKFFKTISIFSFLSYRFSIPILFLFISLVLWSCRSDCDKISDLPEVPFKLIRIEESLFNLKSEEGANALLQAHPLLADKYFQKKSFPHDSILADHLFKFYNNKALLSLKASSDSAFNNIENLKKDLKAFFEHVRYYYPEFYVPPVYTLVTGFQFDKDIVISDSIIAVSIDYFIGKTARYRPAFYKYFLERYEKEFIVPMIALGVSNKFNEVDLKDETMLASMIFYGKAYYFAQQMLPCLHDSLIIQYSGEQIKEVHNNIDIIWGHFIQNKLLFETKPQTIEKYIGESPKVNEIGEKCPGRIGRWLGLEIVKKYVEETNISLQELMAEKDAQKIFRISKFKPERK